MGSYRPKPGEIKTRRILLCTRKNGFFHGKDDKKTPSGSPKTAPITGEEFDCDVLDPEVEQLPPEVEVGNIEYKLRLIQPSNDRLQQLMTQLTWRLAETGDAWYELGVDDDGTLVGLTADQFASSVSTLARMCQNVGASMVSIREMWIKSNSLLHDKSSALRIAEVWIRQRSVERHFVETRIAVLGETRVGKSTLVGVLTTGRCDDGKGKARLNLLRHRHEILTGRTSSVSYDIVGFDSHGNLLNEGADSEESDDDQMWSFAESDVGQGRQWKKVLSRAVKVVSFLDLAGHQKYLKTTISGFVRHLPDYACLVMSCALQSISEIAQEHLNMAIGLGVPVFIVVTKSDLAQETNAIEKIREWLSSYLDKDILLIKDENNVTEAISHMVLQKKIPVFTVSCVTGQGLKLLNQLLFQLFKKDKNVPVLSSDSVEYHIEDVFDVQEIGLVVGGKLIQGVLHDASVNTGTSLVIGPDKRGKYFPVRIRSIHRQRAAVSTVHAGELASLALSGVDKRLVRTGMVILSCPIKSSKSFYEFDAHISVLSCARFVGANAKGLLHVGCVKQIAFVKGIFIEPDNEECRSPTSRKKSCFLSKGQEAVVRFRFSLSPEYLKAGARLYFRDGNTKLMGYVVKPIEEIQ